MLAAARTPDKRSGQRLYHYPVRLAARFFSTLQLTLAALVRVPVALPVFTTRVRVTLWPLPLALIPHFMGHHLP
jgi:hypothetical protein